ncbi:MAG TPA: HAD-IB family phosphatase [Gemmatimonadaceae bacterium]|nr:HAD-IB family phosphatase [Gemmatimonadaceae bacterium]
MSEPPHARCRSLVLDVDSTVVGIEGIDWLAARRGPEVAQQVSALTREAMEGRVRLEDVYALRLERIRPTRDDLDALARAYIDAVAPGAVVTIARVRDAGVHVVLVSGGLRQALLPLARHVGVIPEDLHAVAIEPDSTGTYLRHDAEAPLTRGDGKRDVVASLRLERPIVAVGDGATDLAMRAAADRFVAFTGFASRSNVVAGADASVASFAELERLLVVE